MNFQESNQSQYTNEHNNYIFKDVPFPSKLKYKTNFMRELKTELKKRQTSKSSLKDESNLFDNEKKLRKSKSLTSLDQLSHKKTEDVNFSPEPTSSNNGFIKYDVSKSDVRSRLIHKFVEAFELFNKVLSAKKTKKPSKKLSESLCDLSDKTNKSSFAKLFSSKRPNIRSKSMENLSQNEKPLINKKSLIIFLEQAFQKVESQLIDTEGLYRINGKHDSYEKMDMNEILELDGASLTTGIKKLIRKQTINISLKSINLKEHSSEQFENLLNTMTEEDRMLFNQIFTHFHRIALNEVVNKMSYHNLWVCMAPNIYFDLEPNLLNITLFIEFMSAMNSWYFINF